MIAVVFGMAVSARVVAKVSVHSIITSCQIGAKPTKYKDVYVKGKKMSLKIVLCTYILN